MINIRLFRAFASVFAITFSLIILADAIADVVKPRPAISLNNLPSKAEADRACFSSKVGILRSDLITACALARSLESLRASEAGSLAQNEITQNVVEDALAISPHNSLLWLLLAMLKSEEKQDNSDAIRMCYLTDPNAADDITLLRFANIVSGNALADTDLAALAAGDVRRLLSHRPSFSAELTRSYKKASNVGKRFIEATVEVSDPTLLELLKHEQEK